MSKAFTRESDDAPEPPPMVRTSAPGGKNYVTPTGARRWREELEELSKATNPSAEVKQRILQLQHYVATALVVPAPAEPWEQVMFGATVTVRDEAGEESKYRIVGADEMDLDRDWVSSSSPVARALLKGRLGQKIQFRTPAGERRWEIIGIMYE
jgi:transcription elongation factor GreB